MASHHCVVIWFLGIVQIVDDIFEWFSSYAGPRAPFEFHILNANSVVYLEGVTYWSPATHAYCTRLLKRTQSVNINHAIYIRLLSILK